MGDLFGVAVNQAGDVFSDGGIAGDVGAAAGACLAFLAFQRGGHFRPLTAAGVAVKRGAHRLAHGIPFCGGAAVCRHRGGVGRGRLKFGVFIGIEGASGGADFIDVRGLADEDVQLVRQFVGSLKNRRGGN